MTANSMARAAAVAARYREVGFAGFHVEFEAGIGRLIGGLPAAWQIVCRWRRRAHDRAQLRALTRREIADFCPGQSDAYRESSKPFWQA